MSYRIDDALLRTLNLKRLEHNSGGYQIVIPERCNIAHNTVERYTREHPENTALIFEREDLGTRTWSFVELEQDASRLAHGLETLGIKRGDRVALHTGMRPETGIAHMALHKLGIVAVTLSQLYGPDTLAHILNHAEAKAIITQTDAWARFRDRTDEFETLEHIVVVDGAVGGATDIIALNKNGPASLPSVADAADEKAH